MALGGMCENEPLFVFPVEVYVKRKKKVHGHLEQCTTSAFIRRKREQNSDATILLTVKKKT